MSRAEFTNWAVDEAGNVVASAAFEVRWRSNNSLVTTLYDAASGVGTVSNPGTATSGGLVNFWLPYGEYEVTIGSGASAVTIPFDAAPATGVPRSFASRAAAVTEWAAMVARSETPPAGTVWSFDGVSIEYDGSTTAVPGFSGWKPVEPVNVRHFGAACDGVTDDLAAFNAADNYGKSPVIVDADCLISTGLTGPSVVFETRNGATVTQAGGNFFPVEERRAGRGGEYRQRVNFTAADPSSAYDGSQGVYPILYDGVGFLTQTTNFWGNGDLVANTWRTGIDTFFAGAAHYGKGDYYLYRANGMVYRHADHASVSSIHGHNNIGMFNGQVNAGGDQVTLYGLGDQVLNDAGYDNVAMRGMVIFLDREGDDTHGYTVDRFGYMANSRGSKDIDGGFIVRGKFRAGLDLVGADLSDDAAINLAETQKIFFDASIGAATPLEVGYTADTSGDYWIGKPTTVEYLETGANGSTLRQYANTLDYAPSAQTAYGFRVHGDSDTVASVGVINNTAYFGAFDAGSNNTNIKFQIALAGAERTGAEIKANGNFDLPVAGAKYQIGGTDVLSGKMSTVSAVPTGGSATAAGNATAINAIIAQLQAVDLMA